MTFLRSMRPGACKLIAALVLILASGCTDKPVAEDPLVSELPPVPTISVSQLDEEVQLKFNRVQQKLEADPVDGHYNALFARLLHAYSLHAPASVMYERCVALRPSDLDCLYLEALTKRQLGDNQAAIALLDQLLKRKPGFPRAAVVLADAYRQQGRTDLAQPLFEQAVKQNGDDLEAVYGLAMSLLEKGDLEQAESRLLGLHAGGRHFGIVHAALATISRQQGSLEDAAFHTAAARRFADNKIPFVDSVLWAVQDEQVGDQRLVKDARTLFEQGQLNEAASAYVKATQANPGNSASHNSLIGIYGQLGNIAGAERHFEISRELNPTDVSPLLAMGTTYMKRGNFSGARDLFSTVIELKPEHAEARTLNAYCSELLGEPSQADEFRRAISDDPTQALAHYLLGRNLVKSEDCTLALPHLRASIRIESAQTPAFVPDLVRCLVEQGELIEARQQLDNGFTLARHYRNAGAQKALVQARDDLAAELADPADGGRE